MPDSQIISRPSTKSEWTLIAVLISLCVFALVLVWALLLPSWPVSVVAARVDILGWAVKLTFGGIILVIVAINSPWYGVVKASGLGGSVEIDGKDGVVKSPVESPDKS